MGEREREFLNIFPKYKLEFIKGINERFLEKYNANVTEDIFRVISYRNEFVVSSECLHTGANPMPLYNIYETITECSSKKITCQILSFDPADDLLGDNPYAKVQEIFYIILNSADE